jgi:molybdopterin-containing oxidoreductase family iron-sulfur binding subunit
VTLTVSRRSVQVPAWVQPGHADDAVSVSFGYGRKQHTLGVKDADEPVVVGHDVYPLRSAASPWFVTGLEVKKTGRKYRISTTQVTNVTEGRPIALMQSVEEFEKHPEAPEQRSPKELPGGKELEGRVLPSVMPGIDYSKLQYKWAMAVDMSRCTGCSACVVACQAENNIPVVGKYQVGRGREMHWIRMDRYYSGPAESPEMVNQPMFCQHCETAPCEYVCPVNATVHSPDGLNEMVYNRCVGTRFCSNNCPYKVRRFNWLNYTAQKSQTERMAMNPDVTVRDRGVMEKCTFCVQRIRRADIDAAETESDEPYTRLQTACQQACPTRAIVFGPISDSRGQVARDAAAPQSYEVLHELGTRPRVHYLARLRNLNPALPAVVA